MGSATACEPIIGEAIKRPYFMPGLAGSAITACEGRRATWRRNAERAPTGTYAYESGPVVTRKKAKR